MEELTFGDYYLCVINIIAIGLNIYVYINNKKLKKIDQQIERIMNNLSPHKTETIIFNMKDKKND